MDDIKKTKSSSILDGNFVDHIINGMFDWVRVLDREDNIIYINQSMSEALGGLTIGDKCYKAIGRSAPCENCISRKTVFEGTPHEKEEIINGRVYSVMSSPVKNQNGETIAVVEVLRDVTQVKQLQKKILEQNRKLQSDLNIARKLQCSLLPKRHLEDKIGFSFIYKPCEAIGGDFLDLFKIDDDHMGIYIADVSGHGVPASMLTVFLRSTINKRILSPAEALQQLYRDFNNSSFDHDLYITVFYGIINIKDRILTYSNAGHNACPVLFNKNKFEILLSAGIPISNWASTASYSDKSAKLEIGDKLFMYTDGIVELKNKAGDQYGEKKLLDILLSESVSLSETLSQIIESASKFGGTENLSDVPDDITMALLEIK